MILTSIANKYKLIMLKNILLRLIFTFTLLILMSNCSNDDAGITGPQVTSQTTSSNVEVNFTSIKIDGKVISNGGSNIISRGVCWSINPNPTIDDGKTIESSDIFTSTISNLTANTTYYFRVYANNSIGIGYGQEQFFNTSSLNDTTWDFFMISITDSNSFWHADVTFNADGTTIYTEPNSGNQPFIGSWSLNDNTLEYELYSSTTEPIFLGVLFENAMNGTFSLNNETVLTWEAIKY